MGCGCAGTEYLGDDKDWAKRKRACLKRAVAKLGLKAVVTVQRGKHVRVMPKTKQDIKRWHEIVTKVEGECTL